MTPWHFLRKPQGYEGAAKALLREDVHEREVFVFASRQDRDDYAGLLIENGVITDRVLCFHPVFASEEVASARNWNIVQASYEDVFDFVARQVIPDMKEWAKDEDASDL